MNAGLKGKASISEGMSIDTMDYQIVCECMMIFDMFHPYLIGIYRVLLRLPSGNVNIAIENGAFSLLIYLLKMLDLSIVFCKRLPVWVDSWIWVHKKGPLKNYPAEGGS